MLLTEFESHNARVSSWLDKWQTMPTDGNQLECAAALVRERGLSGKRVGIEMGRFSSVTAFSHMRLRELLSNVTLVEIAELVERVRAIKSPAEVEYMRRAGQITAAGMHAAVAAAADGAMDNDMAAAAYHAMISAGSEYPCYPPFITVGRRSGIPHTTFRRTRIKAGDPIFVEVGASICRYNSPMLRTVVVGKPSDQVKRMADACCASVETMLRTLRAGITAAEVAEKSSQCLKGLPDHLVWHGFFGYSVGLGFPPSWSDCVEIVIKKDNPVVLQAGMTYHCSTSLRDVGRCGTTCSETVLITDDGCEVLTGDVPRTLLIR
jgi:Xaa-Pro aminopeptidase